MNFLDDSFESLPQLIKIKTKPNKSPQIIPKKPNFLLEIQQPPISELKNVLKNKLD